MQLVLVHPLDFKNAQGLVSGITEYFPRLIAGHRLQEDASLASSMGAEEIDQIVDDLAHPHWGTEVVFLLVSGPIYAFEELPLNNCAGTIQSFRFGEERSLPKVPKIGGYYNMRQVRALGLEGDTRFLSKLGAEEILHIFDVPKEHDRSCFFHPEEHPCQASCGYEFCPKCRTLMNVLVEPLDFATIYGFVDQLYGGSNPARTG